MVEYWLMLTFMNLAALCSLYSRLQISETNFQPLHFFLCGGKEEGDDNSLGQSVQKWQSFLSAATSVARSQWTI